MAGLIGCINILPDITTQQHCHYVDTIMPDPFCTPGAVDQHVTQANIQQTICQPGYTATVRPAPNYTAQVKEERLRAYGQDVTNKSHYELDHLVPLELGGAPVDIGNLWPEPEPSFHQKDIIENELHQQVCNNQIQLAVAQQRIIKDWRIALQP